MISRYTFSALLLGCASFILFQSNAGGPAQNGNRATGAPGDGSSTCESCHNNNGSFGNVSIDFEMTNASGAAVTEYKPDSVYSVKITVNNSAGSPAGFGFQMICLKDANDGNLQGWSNPSANAQLSTSAGRNYVEHDGISTTNIFTVDWTAPSESTGDVTFYLGANAVNGADGNAGDRAKIDKFTIAEANGDSVSTSVREFILNEFSVFPNPVKDNIRIAGLSPGSPISIYSALGTLLRSERLNNEILNLSDLESGIYIIQTESGAKRILKL